MIDTTKTVCMKKIMRIPEPRLGKDNYREEKASERGSDTREFGSAIRETFKDFLFSVLKSDEF